MNENTNFLNLALAKALGLETKNLIGFELIAKACEVPQVRATYLVRSADGLHKILQLYEIRPTGQIGQRVPEGG